VTCGCHDAPAYWTTDPRYKAGGFWRCAVRKRGYQRDRYDNDPIYRIEKNLRNDARKRRQRIVRRRSVHVSDGGDI
jgi:hypothetical protein